MLTNKRTHIHWFVNDLRLTDQPFLRLLEHKTHHFGVYIIDPRKHILLKEGFRKTGIHRLQLLWRDYFRHAGKYYRDKLFYASGINTVQKNQSNNLVAFQKWTNGIAGNKFIDTNMKELALTGYMSNRGRQNVASYLVHNMNISCNLGVAWFEKNLLDYDVYSNQGNWMRLVGAGFNPNGTAVFDIDFQTERYAPAASYQNQWIIKKIVES